jgi:VCBS repeat-containing protein
VGGDVIVAIDNQPVKTQDDFAAYLKSSASVNHTFTLTILRDGQQQDVKVKVTPADHSRPSIFGNTLDRVQSGKVGSGWAQVGCQN